MQLGPVEDRGGSRYALQLELARQLFHGEGLARAALRAPAEQGQVVHQRLRQDAHLAEAGDGGCSVALRQALAIAAQDGREMRELRHLPPKGLVDRHLLGGVRDMVIAADDVGDLHQRVVNGDDIVIDGHAR